MQFWRRFSTVMIVFEMAMFAYLFRQFMPTYLDLLADVGDAARIPLFVLTTLLAVTLTGIYAPILRIAGNIK